MIYSQHQQNMIDRASLFSYVAHQAVGQKRKYTGEPYYQHPASVARIVKTVKDISWDAVAVAYLHDTVEDTGITEDDILLAFGQDVRKGVWYLTDVEKFAGNRKTRKELDLQRLVKAPRDIKTVKIADLLDNTDSIVLHDPGFAPVYLTEKRELLRRALIGGDETLWKLAFDKCNDGLKALGIIS